MTVTVAMYLERGLALVAGLSFALSACSLADDAPDYRYRLTVEVETPQGLRTGSSVIGVETSVASSRSIPTPGAVRHRVRGEAVAVDLPDGRTLFALLRSDNDTDWAGRVMFLRGAGGLDFEARYNEMLRNRRELELPRMWPRMGHLDPRSAWPMLVTFGDLADPTSVSEVDPDDMAASFGEGYAINRITVQLTDEPVTTGIEERLGWLSGHPEPSLKPNHALDDYSLAATLKHRAFRQGEFR